MISRVKNTVRRSGLGWLVGFALSSVGFAQMASPSYADVIKLLSGPKGQEEANRLAGRGKAGEDALILGTYSDNALIRLRAVKALGKLNDRKALDRIVMETMDHGAGISEESVRILRGLGPRSADLVIEGLSQLSYVVPVLQQFLVPNDQAGVKLFRRVLRRHSASQRVVMVRAAGALLFPHHPDLFRAVAHDRSSKVRAALLQTINWDKPLKGEAAYAMARLRDPDPQVRIVAIQTLYRQSSPSAEPLFRMFRDPDPGVRDAANQAIHYVRFTRRLVGREAKLVADKNAHLADAMVRILVLHVRDYSEMSSTRDEADRKIGILFDHTDTKRLRNVLYRRLRHGSPPIFSELLGLLGDPRAFPYLEKQVSLPLPRRGSREDHVDFALAFSDGERAVPILVSHLKDPDNSMAVQALGLTRSNAAIPPLIQELAKHRTNDWAADSLVSLGAGARAAPAINALARNKSFDVQMRGNLLFRLGELGGPGSVKTLLDILDDPALSSIYWQAHAGMQALRDPAVISDLQQAVKERKGESLKEAQAALNRLSTKPS